MFKLFGILWNSFRMAIQELRVNKLRTFLSLFGITIGIFCIIGVLATVDSLERKVQNDIKAFGNNTIYIDKWSYAGGPDYPWWKYFQRPPGTFAEYKFLEERLKNADGVTISASSNATIQAGSNSFEGSALTGIAYTYQDVFEVALEEGRYFSESEINAARNLIIIGKKIATTLFPNQPALGKEVKIKGMKFTVIGIFEEEGEGFLELPSKDEACLIPFGAFSKMYYTGKNGLEPTIAAKGRDTDIGLVALENEMTGLMRAKRGLKPTQEDNFALNKTEFIQNAIGSIFDVISVAGWVIGGFSILVGGFGIANIMFVSVRERTNIIGIQKSLGAKNYFILFQFLFEAIILCVIGGAIGLLLVWIIAMVLTKMPFDLTIATQNNSLKLC